jgi:hypothetical protein
MDIATARDAADQRPGGEEALPAIYQYLPLENHDSIRLLILLPSSESEEDLRCELIHARLREDPHYEALSYTWGAAHFPETLHADESIIRITENLMSALTQFRLRNAPRTLWVDAICINQQDVEEKGRQVMAMANIYRRSCRVLAWLGPGTEDTDRALSHFRKLADLGPDFGLPTELDGQVWLHTPTLVGGKESIESIVIEAKGQSVDAIYARSWFTRLWIVQEVVLGPQTTICCGSGELDWNVFAAAMVIIYAAMVQSGEIVQDHASFNHAWEIIIVRAQQRATSLPSLSMYSLYHEFGSLIYRLRGQHCQEDHDRIYALLGLCPRFTGFTMTPNYSQPVARVYADFARAHLLHDNDIEVLFHAGLWERNDPPSDEPPWEDQLQSPDYLPSWVPEYRISQLRGGGLVRLLPWDNSHFYASNIHRSVVQVPTGDPNQVLIRGFLLDAIAGRIYEAAGLDRPDFPHMCDFISLCKSKLGSFGPADTYPTGEQPDRAFARTMAADGAGNILQQLFRDGRGIERSPDHLLALWLDFERQCYSPGGELYNYLSFVKDLKARGNEGILPFTFISLSPAALRAMEYGKCIYNVLRGNRFFVTNEGYIGIGPPGTEHGDIVVILDGVRTPFVVRPLEKGRPLFKVVGSCYLHGAMLGETDQMDVEEWRWGMIPFI